MKRRIEAIRGWWIPFFKKHEAEINVSFTKAPAIGVGLILFKDISIWWGIFFACEIIIAAWVTAYFVRRYKNKKRNEKLD